MKKRAMLRAAGIVLMSAAMCFGGAQVGRADGGLLAVSGVVYLDEVPVAGVKVCDYVSDSRCVLTAADGSYTVQVDPKPTYGGCLTVNPVTAEHKALFGALGWGHHNGVCDLRVTSNDRNNIHIKSFPIATGRVVNAAGHPIAGAAVNGGQYNQTVTDAAGGFASRIEQWDGRGGLIISAPGYEKAYKVQYSGGVNFGTIMMAPAGQTDRYSINGVVTNPQGDPVAGAAVCVVGGDCVATTDAKGAYAALLPGRTAEITSWYLQASVAGKRALATLTVSSEYWTNFTAGADFRLSVLSATTPKIAGRLRVGSVLVARVGHWSPAPVEMRYQWYANGKKITGATKPSLRLKLAQWGKRIAVKVTGSKAGYDSVVKCSLPTKRVKR